MLIIAIYHCLTIASFCETGDALNALKTNLADPNNVLQSWDNEYICKVLLFGNHTSIHTFDVFVAFWFSLHTGG